MRILIITDSLGLPRVNVPVETTWTYRFMLSHSFEGHVFYTILRGDQHTGDLQFDRIEVIKPDLIICQLGIVDCSKRVLPRVLLSIVSRIPGFSSVFRRFAKKHHYWITKHTNIKVIDEKKFRLNIQRLAQLNVPVCFIKIADAGEMMRKKVFDCQKDIDNYNKILLEEITLIDPYKNYFADDYTLAEDGHHLNDFGHNLVYNMIQELYGDKLSGKF